MVSSVKSKPYTRIIIHNASSGGAGAGSIPAATTRYFGLSNGMGMNATETNVHAKMYGAGVITRFRIYAGTAPSVGTAVFTLRVNAADTAATVSVATGATVPEWFECTTPISFVDGDLVDVKAVGADTGSVSCPSVVFEINLQP